MRRGRRLLGCPAVRLAAAWLPVLVLAPLASGAGSGAVRPVATAEISPAEQSFELDLAIARALDAAEALDIALDQVESLEAQGAVPGR